MTIVTFKATDTSSASVQDALKIDLFKVAVARVVTHLTNDEGQLPFN
jgi:hypothetical protein